MWFFFSRLRATPSEEILEDKNVEIDGVIATMNRRHGELQQVANEMIGKLKLFAEERGRYTDVTRPD